MGSKKDMTTFSVYTKFNAGEPLPDNTGIPIEGFAIHDGLFKEIVEIPKTELKNAEKTIATAQFRKNHGQDVEDVIGKVMLAHIGFDEIAQKDGVFYQAFIDQDESKIAGKVAKGLVNDVSIGFDMTPECSECGEDFRRCPHWFDEAHIIARDIDIHEVSLVSRGADADATANIKSFKAQFDYKRDEHNIKNNTEEIKKDINVIKGGEFMAEEQDNAIDMGDIVSKLTASQKEAIEAKQLAQTKTAEADGLATKLKAAEDARDALELEKTELTSTKDELEKDNTSKSEALTARELADKKAEVSKIVDDEISRKLQKETNKDARIEELMGTDQVGLDQIKDLVSKFDIPTSSPAKVPMTEGFEKYLDQSGELDITNKEVKQRYTHDIFRYDRVFDQEPEKAIPGRSYMGFYSHLQNRMNMRG
jgi:hypothetical protein